MNRIANRSPSITTTITTEGLPVTNVGTVSHPTLAATNLAASMRRWRLTSAAVVDSVAEQRASGWACWRGNAAGLGGWTFVTRHSLTTLQTTGMGFFGLYGSIAALATNLTLATVINAVGIGFQRGTHANWQLVTNDSTGAPTLTDMGAPFAVALGGVLTLIIAAPPNGSSVWVRAVNEVTGAVFKQEITADLPANTQFLSPRFYLNTGATAAAVAYDCLGKPLIVRSGYRSPSHNRAVGGAPASKHMMGTAFAIAMSNHDPVAFAEAARAVGFLGFGTYPRSGFMHIDLGPARSWGEPFPVRATHFVPETQPVREVLADSRTLKGGGAAGIATVGAAGVEVAQEVTAETQSAILPLVPYIDTLRWVFIAVALIGIAVTIHARIDD